MSEKPFPDSYWIIPDQFLAGAYPGYTKGGEDLTRRRVAALLEAGMDTFIDLTRPGESASYVETLHAEAERYSKRVDYQPKPIEDKGLPSVGQMTAILDSIDAALSAGRKVYLHCLGGIGRTGTVVGCWLARHGLTGEEALARLNGLYRASQQSRFFSRSPEMDAQLLFILDWKEAARSEPAALARSKQKRAETVDWHVRFLQQAAWTRQLRDYIFERIGLKKARMVLEVGCGTGAILADLPVQSGVHGLDRSAARLKEAARHYPQGSFACGDARKLPYATGAFEVTFCHFLLLWVPQPVEALREMARVTAPGGYVIAFAEPDYRARVDKPAALAPLGRWQSESLLRQGADPDLGGRLGKLFPQAGIGLIETGKLKENDNKTPTQAEWQQEWAVLEADLRDLVPAQELRRLKHLDQQAWQGGERRLSVPTHFAWGRVGPMV